MDDQKQKKAKTPVAQGEELAKVQAERDEYKNKYLRALADYQNLEKRMEEGRAEAVKRVYADVLHRLLPFLDHLEKAEMFLKDEGLKMIVNQYNETLQEIGLEKLDLVGKPFDPHLAEAIEVVVGDKDNIVVGVVRNGYRFEGKVLRVARVKVSKIKNSL